MDKVIVEQTDRIFKPKLDLDGRISSTYTAYKVKDIFDSGRGSSRLYPLIFSTWEEEEKQC